MFEFLGFGKKDKEEVLDPDIEQPIVEAEKGPEFKFDGPNEVFYSEDEALKYIAEELNKTLKLEESSRDAIRASDITIEKVPVRDTGKEEFEGGLGGWGRTMILRATIKDNPIQNLEIRHRYGVSDSKHIVGNPTWRVEKPRK